MESISFKWPTPPNAPPPSAPGIDSTELVLAIWGTENDTQQLQHGHSSWNILNVEKENMASFAFSPSTICLWTHFNCTGSQPPRCWVDYKEGDVTDGMDVPRLQSMGSIQIALRSVFLSCNTSLNLLINANWHLYILNTYRGQITTLGTPKS